MIQWGLALGVLAAPVLGQESILTVPENSVLTLQPLLAQRISEPTEVTVQPRAASDEMNWPDHCLLSLTLTPGAAMAIEPGKMVCITEQRQIIEAVPEGDFELGDCVADGDQPCATVELDPENPGTVTLTAPLQLTLQPRNVF
jgi:hypothetical protein